MTLLNMGYAISSKPKLDLFNARMMKKEQGEGHLRQDFQEKSLMIFVHDPLSNSLEYSSQEDSLTSQDQTDEIFEAGKKILRTNNVKERNTIVPPPLHLTRLKLNKTERMLNRKTGAAEKEHQRKIKEIVDHVTHNYQSNIYFTYEARRIAHTRIVIDELRQMAEDINKPRYRKTLLKAKALHCGKPVYEPPPFVWPKPNTAFIHVIKNTMNDGEYFIH